MTMQREVSMRSELEPRDVRSHHKLWKMRNACRLSVNVIIGVVLGGMLVVRGVPVFVCDDAVVHHTLVLIAFHRSH